MKEISFNGAKYVLKWLLLVFLPIVAFLRPLGSNAQSTYSSVLIPSSPAASSLAQAGDMPINLYEGRPEITVPLYSIKTRTLSSNISLKYIGGNGIKVQAISGPAGLGWALSAGGVITRTVRGLPDEHAEYGYCMTNKAGIQADLSSSTFRNSLNDLVENNDLEPDVFNSSFGGRIVFNYAKQPMFTNDQGYIIKKNGLFSSDSTWEIVDTKGIRYLFGKSTNEREHTISSVNGISEEQHFISSWYLSEIISPDGEVFKFSYVRGDISFTSYVSESKIITHYTQLRSNNVNVQVWDPVYLQQISSPNAKLTFTYRDRWDNPGQKSIEKIVVINASGGINSAFRFRTGYFSDGGSNLYARPKLLAVEQLDTTQQKYIKIAGFNYFEQELLPDKNSPQYDHWGYYNNNTTGKRFVSDGAIRSADLNKCKAGVLTSIDWPNGGRTEYDYELNTYRKYNIDRQGAGLRVKKIRQIDGGNAIESSYSYLNADNTSSGLLQTRFNPDSGYVSKSTYSYSFNAGGSIIDASGAIEVENNLPIFQLFDINGVGVGYSRIQVTHPDSSRDVQLFQDYNEFPNQELGVFLASKMHYSENITSSYSPALYGIFNFYSPAIQQRGLLKERQLFNKAGVILQKSIYKYKSSDKATAPVVRGVQKRLYNSYTPEGGSEAYNSFVGAVYQEYVTTPQLLSEEIYTYSQGSQTLAIKKFTRNEYKSNYPYLLSKTTESSSDGDSLILTYTYPYEVRNTNQSGDVATFMTSLNMVERLETVSRIKRAGVETVTNAELRLFSSSGTVARPSKINQLETIVPISNYQSMGTGMTIDSRSKPNVSFDLYAPSGELLQYHEGNSMPKALIWGCRHQLVVAEVIGATYSTAVQYVDTALLNSGTLNDASLRSELDKIRKNLTTAQVKSYTYTSLGAMTSETDAAGRSIYYAYDAFSRLRTVKDMKGNILKQYDYYVSTAGGWEDTQIKRCLTDASGQYTGEEQVQEIDKEPSSSSYNQTRWRSLGHTSNCNNTVYVKLAIENSRIESYDEQGQVLWFLTYGNVVAYFYQDPACTIPRNVTNLNVTYKVNPVDGGPRPPTYPSKTVLCNGKSTILALQEIQEASTMDFPQTDIKFQYSVSPGPGYIGK